MSIFGHRDNAEILFKINNYFGIRFWVPNIYFLVFWHLKLLFIFFYFGYRILKKKNLVSVFKINAITYKLIL